MSSEVSKVFHVGNKVYNKSTDSIGTILSTNSDVVTVQIPEHGVTRWDTKHLMLRPDIGDEVKFDYDDSIRYFYLSYYVRTRGIFTSTTLLYENIKDYGSIREVCPKPLQLNIGDQIKLHSSVLVSIPHEFSQAVVNVVSMPDVSLDFDVQDPKTRKITRINLSFVHSLVPQVDDELLFYDDGIAHEVTVGEIDAFKRMFKIQQPSGTTTWVRNNKIVHIKKGGEMPPESTKFRIGDHIQVYQKDAELQKGVITAVSEEIISYHQRDEPLPELKARESNCVLEPPVGSRVYFRNITRCYTVISVSDDEIKYRNSTGDVLSKRLDEIVEYTPGLQIRPNQKVVLRFDPEIPKTLRGGTFEVISVDQQQNIINIYAENTSVVVSINSVSHLLVQVGDNVTFTNPNTSIIHSGIIRSIDVSGITIMSSDTMFTVTTENIIAVNSVSVTDTFKEGDIVLPVVDSYSKIPRQVKEVLDSRTIMLTVGGVAKVDEVKHTTLPLPDPTKFVAYKDRRSISVYRGDQPLKDILYDEYGIEFKALSSVLNSNIPLHIDCQKTQGIKTIYMSNPRKGVKIMPGDYTAVLKYINTVIEGFS